MSSKTSLDATDNATLDFQRRLALAAIARGENVAANMAWLEAHPETMMNRGPSESAAVAALMGEDEGE